MIARVLFVDDDAQMRHSTAQALRLAGFQVEALTGGEEALALAGPGFAEVVVSDIRMPGMDGMTLLERLHEVDPEVPVILVTGHAEVPLAVEAIRNGAYDFIEKPFVMQELATVIRRAIDHRALVLENRQLRAVAGKRDDVEARLPGRTQVMVDLRYRLRAIGASDADALIIGPTGAGKEVVARALHDISARAGLPFIAINCAALPQALIESELFGHEAGAFPGALRPRYGKFEHAAAARCCWTRSGRCRFICRRSCCACCRNGSSPASARTSRSRWTCASSPRPKSIWRRRWQRGGSGRTCITG